MLTQKQKLALESLLGGGTQKEAAAKAGVSRTMINRWLKLPEFKNLLKRPAEHICDEVLDGLRPLLNLAMNALADCLTNGNGTVKVKAADVVLGRFGEWHERA